MVSKKFMLLGLGLLCGVAQASEVQKKVLEADQLIAHLNRDTPFVIAPEHEIYVRKIVSGTLTATLEGTLQLGKENLRDIALEPDQTYRVKAKQNSIPDEFAYRIILNTKAGGQLRLSDAWENPYVYNDTKILPPEKSEAVQKAEERCQVEPPQPQKDVICSSAVTFSKDTCIDISPTYDNIWLIGGIYGDIIIDFARDNHVYVGLNPVFEVPHESGTYLLRPEEGTYDDQFAIRIIAHFVEGSRLHFSCPWTAEPYDESQEIYPRANDLKDLITLKLKTSGNTLAKDGTTYISEAQTVLPIPGDPGVIETKQ